MRLIDADALRKFLHEDDFDTPDERWKPESEFAKMIDALPTVDIKTEVAKEIFAEIENHIQAELKTLSIFDEYEDDFYTGERFGLEEISKKIAELKTNTRKRVKASDLSM